MSVLNFRLARFIEYAMQISREKFDPGQCVTAIAPAMMELLGCAADFLEPRHYKCDFSQYSRNLIYQSPNDDLSLYALVWCPGQWTPVHDHGSWGVVGIVEGVLEEHSYVYRTIDDGCSSGLELVRGGTFLLTPGAVAGFVPNPDHIHATGVSVGRPRAVSLHLYGRMMSSYNVYDVERGTRTMVEIKHNC